MKSQRKTGLRIAAAAAALALTLVSCSSNAGTPAASSPASTPAGGGAPAGNVSITFLPKNLGNPYFDTSSKGGKAAVEEFGGTFAEVGPATATPDAQVS